MTLQDKLLSKNGQATIRLSKQLLNYRIGEKIPTITEFSSVLGLSRGTVQNALKNLIDSEAVRIESKGHLGSYLTKKNTRLLLEFAGITYLVGAMPLHYTKRYEGLASGLIVALENHYNIPVTLAYMRGSLNRISMVLQGRYDFAVTSRYAANEFIKNHPSIEPIISLGPGSYLSSHVLMFHNPNDHEITDGMKVGIDHTSFDQKLLTEKACEGKKVEFIPIEYSRIIERIISGDIDATVMNIDEALDKRYRINYRNLPELSDESTEAVIVVNNQTPEIGRLLTEMLDVETVLNIQRLVMEEKIIPSY